MSEMDNRINKLELIWSAPRCPTCLGKPSRIVTVDPVTDEMISESMPETGCARCGAPVHREYVLIPGDESRGA
jgi:hypothetical protein